MTASTPYRESAKPESANADTLAKRVAFLASTLASIVAVVLDISSWGFKPVTLGTLVFEVFMYAAAGFLVLVIGLFVLSAYFGNPSVFNAPERHPRAATLAFIWWPVTIVLAMLYGVSRGSYLLFEWIRHGARE